MHESIEAKRLEIVSAEAGRALAALRGTSDAITRFLSTFEADASTRGPLEFWRAATARAAADLESAIDGTDEDSWRAAAVHACDELLDLVRDREQAAPASRRGKARA